LRSADDFDGFHERRLNLALGRPITIGRASSNPQKPELMAASTNAFIDSPVISREHAVLTMQPNPLAVYITDKKSMHGTMVNGDRLEPLTPAKLASGDVLQFGTDVTRDKGTPQPRHHPISQADTPNPDHYLARKYTFESHSPATPFVHGFTVPEVDTSEDEEVENDVKNYMPSSIRYGSQANPVTLDHLPHAAHIIDLEEEDDTMVGTALAETTEAREMDEPPDFLDVLREVVLDNHDYSSSMEEDKSSTYSSEGDDSRWPLVDDYDNGSVHNDDSDAASISDSESPAEISTSEEGESGGEEDIFEQEGRANELAAELHANDQSDIDETWTTAFGYQQQVATPQREPSLARPMTYHFTGFSEGESKAPEPSNTAENTQGGVFDSPYANNTTYREWSPVLSSRREYVSPYTPREPNNVRTDEERISNVGVQGITPSPILFFNYAETIPPKPFNYAEIVPPKQFNYAEIVPLKPFNYAEAIQPKPSTTQNAQPPTHFAFSNARIPTTPPGPVNAPPFGVQTSPAYETPTSQPVRRTRMSIPEIVEDFTPQPLTPTSESGNLKRKAEVLEEIVGAAVEPFRPDAISEPAAVAEPVSMLDIASAPVTTAPERPKKRMRAAFGAAKRVAGLLIPGTALAVGVLTQLPNEFWMG
jgi:hypothetical protein